MSNNVDNKVVALGFDNAQFESGTKQSMSTLDKLKKSLNLDEASKSLANLAHTGKSFNLGNIAAGVENVSSKFSALGAIGFTVLQNLTNSAINFGKKLLNSFTAPIKQGLSEYETQINAIQTVLANTASKGTTLDEVNAALNLLNTYADKTIYNFTEMTRNIGTFTAAGVDLKTSVDSIKGIANLAAVSGSNSQQAATAMYQLSQAISTGTVRLMDWNSVVNAGMGGQVFQDALLETARVNGVAVDAMIEKQGSFRASLEEGWLSSEILTQTLAKFTGDLNEEQLRSIGYTEEQIKGIMKLGEMANDAATKVKTFTQLKETIQESLVSGWAKSWQIVMGDFEEAKTFFTEVSNTLGPMIQSSSDARNKILQDWKKFGGRTILIEALKNIFEGILSIVKPIKEAFKEIFPREMLEGQKLKLLTVALRDFSEKLKLSGENADRVKRIFKGIFAAFDIVRDVVVTLMKAFFDLGSSVAPSGSSILEFIAKIADFIVKFREGTDITKGFNDALLKVKDVFNDVRNIIILFSNTVKEKFAAFKSQFSDTFNNVDTSGIETFFEKLKIRFTPFTSLFKGLGFVLQGFMNLAKKAAPIFFKLAAVIGNFLAGIGTAILEGLQNVDFEKVFDTINSGLIGMILLAIKKFLDSGTGFINEASGVFGGLAGILNGVRGSLEAWQQNLKAKTLLAIASAIGILALSLVVLASIDSKKLTISLAAVTAMLTQLITSMALLNKTSAGFSLKTSAGLIALSISILIVSTALAKLSKIDKAGLDQGLGALTALSFGMVVIANLMSKNSGSILKGSVGLIAFGIALLVMTKSVEKLSSLDPARLTNGLIGVGIMLAEIVAFMKLVDLDKMGMTKGAGLLLLAGSILVLSLVVEKFSTMDPAKMQQGLIALAAVLVEVALFTRLTSNGAGIIATAVGMTILAVAMLILVEAISKLADMSWEELAKGMAGMAGALLIIVAAVNMMPPTMILSAVGLVLIAGALVIMAQALNAMGGMSWEEIGKGLAVLAGSLLILTVALYALSGTLAGSAALLVAAAALAVLTPVLTTLGSMDLINVGIALLALAGVFLVLAIAGYALTPVIPTLLGLGMSMMLIGVAAMLVGVGLLAFSVGLSAIAVSGAAAAIAIVAMISTILGIIPVIIKTLIDTIIIFAQGIVEATPFVRDAILALLLAVLDIIIQTTPKLLKALTILLEGLIQLIIDVVPDFIDAVLYLLLRLLQSIADKMPEFIQAGFDILIAFLKGIRDNIADVVTVVSEIVVEFLGAVADNLPDIIDAGWNLAIEFINGMADSVDKNMQPMLDAMGRLATNIISGLVAGISKGAAAVLKALKDIVDAAIEAIKKKLLMKSPSKLMERFGRYIPLGLIIGIKAIKSKLVSTMEDLGTSVSDVMGGVISKINDSLNTNMDMQPTIRPVLDLSDIRTGGKELDTFLGRKSFNMVPILARTSLVSGGMSGPSNSNQAINPGSVITFQQNNYSPKALSRIEIYRQTKNQLITLKGLVR